MPTNNVKKICNNCGRTMLIIAGGMCGGCYYAGKNCGFEKGTPEYDAALAAAKERFTNPNHKQKRSKKTDCRARTDARCPPPERKTNILFRHRFDCESVNRRAQQGYGADQ